MVSSDGRVHDPNRITFLNSYIGAMQKAYDEGANVAGYFLWTFLDNFEWADGYKQRFGIVYVDFASQRRIVKDSAFWYQKIIETNGRMLTMNQTTKEILFLDPVCTHNILSLIHSCVRNASGRSQPCGVAGGKPEGRGGKEMTAKKMVRNIEPDDPMLQYSGRIDDDDPKAPVLIYAASWRCV